MVQGLAATVDYANASNVHPVGLVALLLGCAAVFGVRRGLVPVVLFALAAFLPSAQRIVVAGADFNFVRVLALVGMIRILMRGEAGQVRWGLFDAVVAIAGAMRIVGFFLSRGDPAALITSIGSNFEILGCYLVFRSTLASREDLSALLRGAALITLAVVPFFLLESATGRNLFAVFGGVPEVTAVREGKLRCQGAIAHPILAGCYFASLIPLWIGFFLIGRGKDRLLASVGVGGALAITVCCASSTPVVAAAQAIFVWMLFPLRAWLRFLWIGAILLGIVLHFARTKPIWFLIARIDAVGGSTGWHRSHLIDAAVRHLGEWWMFGTRSTAHWGWGLQDVTNQFVLDGVNGGLGAVVLLVTLMVLAFRAAGRLIRRGLVVRTAKGGAARDESVLGFAMGVAVLVQMCIFLAVSYFGQTVMIWQLILAIAAAMRDWSLAPGAAAAGVSPVVRSCATQAGAVGAVASIARIREGGVLRVGSDRREVEPLPWQPDSAIDARGGAS
jgi:hypothetical protein